MRIEEIFVGVLLVVAVASYGFVAATSSTPTKISSIRMTGTLRQD